MVQTRKEHRREAFVAAAAGAFVELGYEATSMAAVAERAGSSVGNLYKYFPSKQQLFQAAVPAELVVELSRRTRARMRALGAVKDIRQLQPSAEYHALAGELLDYCLANRAAVVFVLARAEGTVFADFREKFVTSMVEWSLEYARGPYPALPVTAELRFALHHAYDSFVRGVASALLRYPGDAQARHVIALVTHQHQGGLKRLFEICEGEPDAQPKRPAPPRQLGKAAGSRARDPQPTRASASPDGPRAGQADRARRARRRR